MQQLREGNPEFPLPSDRVQLFRGDPKTFLGQPEDIAKSLQHVMGHPWGPPSGGTCSEHFTREASRRHQNQVPKLSNLAALNMEKQRLDSESLPGDKLPSFSLSLSLSHPPPPLYDTHQLPEFIQNSLKYFCK